MTETDDKIGARTTIETTIEKQGGTAAETATETTTEGAESTTGTGAEKQGGAVAGAGASWPLRIAAFFLDGSLTVVTTFLAATGQVAFGVWAGIIDERKFLIPGITELFALAFLVKGYLRARANKSPLLYWVVSAAFGAFAVWTNLVHGDAAIIAAADPSSLDLIGGADASGLIFGIASAACQVLWFVGAYEAYQKYRERNGRARKARAKFGDLWLTDTRVTFRAWRISGRMQIDNVEKCLDIADQWIMLFERFRQATLTTKHVDKKTGEPVEAVRQVGSMLARRSAWREVLIANGAKLASIPQTAGLAVIGEVSTSTMSQRDVPPPAPADEPAAEPDASGPQGPSRRRPSPRPRRTAVDDAGDDAGDVAADSPAGEERHVDPSPAGQPTAARTVSSISTKVNEDRRQAERIFNLICAAITEDAPETPRPQSWKEAKDIVVARKLLNGVVAASGFGKNKVYRLIEKGPELFPMSGDRRSA